MACAVEFCQALDGEMDLQWYGWSLGWTLSLEERPELGGQVKEYRKMHLHCCLKLRKEMKNEELDYKAELMAVLEAETARMEGLVMSRVCNPFPIWGSPASTEAGETNHHHKENHDQKKHFQISGAKVYPRHKG